VARPRARTQTARSEILRTNSITASPTNAPNLAAKINGNYSKGRVEVSGLARDNLSGFFLRIFFPMQPLSWLEKEEIDKTKNADFSCRLLCCKV